MEMIMLLIAIVVSALVTSLLLWYSNKGFDGSHSNIGYLLTPDCVHESLVFEEETQRSFLRIALPPETKE